MFSSIPLHALFWTLPFTFTPYSSSLLYLEGQSIGEFKQFQIGAQHRGLSGACSHQQLDAFQSLAADIGGNIKINPSLRITASVQLNFENPSASSTQMSYYKSL